MDGSSLLHQDHRSTGRGILQGHHKAHNTLFHKHRAQRHRGKGSLQWPSLHHLTSHKRSGPSCWTEFACVCVCVTWPHDQNHGDFEHLASCDLIVCIGPLRSGCVPPALSVNDVGCCVRLPGSLLVGARPSKRTGQRIKLFPLDWDTVFRRGHKVSGTPSIRIRRRHPLRGKDVCGSPIYRSSGTPSSAEVYRRVFLESVEDKGSKSPGTSALQISAEGFQIVGERGCVWRFVSALSTFEARRNLLVKTSIRLPSMTREPF